MEALQSPADVPKALYEVTVGALKFIGERLGLNHGWSDLPHSEPKAEITYFPEEEK